MLALDGEPPPRLDATEDDDPEKIKLKMDYTANQHHLLAADHAMEISTGLGWARFAIGLGDQVSRRLSPNQERIYVPVEKLRVHGGMIGRAIAMGSNGRTRRAYVVTHHEEGQLTRVLECPNNPTSSTIFSWVDMGSIGYYRNFWLFFYQQCQMRGWAFHDMAHRILMCLFGY